MKPEYVLGLDTETTGLKVEEGDRIIEICCQMVRVADRKRIINITKRFSNEGRKMNAKAQAVHGIAAADLVGKPKFSTFAPSLAKMMAKLPLIVAHNAKFDMEFIVHHMVEAGQTIPFNLMVYDSMGEGMTTSYDAKPPSLREYCWAMGVEYDPGKAHAADYDVDVMLEAFFNGLDRNHITLPDIKLAA